MSTPTPPTFDLRGRTCLVTGANTGIGLVTARELARRGAHVHLACRSAEKAAPALASIEAAIKADGSPGSVAFLPLDLSNLDSVRACADALEADARPLHILVANAGLAGQRGLTASGFELAFGTNHVGHALLVRRLLPRLAQSATPEAPARVVIVASRAHTRVKAWSLDGVQQTTATRTGFPEYSASKLANVYFARSLHQRIAAHPSLAGKINVYSLHPGVVASDIWRKVPPPFRWLIKQFMVTVDEGAQTQLHCATAPALAHESGVYYDKSRPKAVSKLAEHAGNAEELWLRTADWIGVSPEL